MPGNLSEKKGDLQITTAEHLYQLEIDSTEQEWETTYLVSEFRAIKPLYN